MSIGHVSDDEDATLGKKTEVEVLDESENRTPRSETAPIAVNITTPTEIRYLEAPVEDGYFAMDPARERKARSPSPAITTKPMPTMANSTATASRYLSLTPEHGAVVQSMHSQERPIPTRAPSTMSNISIESTDSTATVTAANLASSLPIPTATQRRTSDFPDQSYAALQQQQYPPPHLPSTLRARSSHPSQMLTFSSALASMHQSGIRTVGNSPTATPGGGLFTPVSPPARTEPDSADSSGTYSSPFLHFTHRQVPKETHVADVDVDPISGRKLINHYEVIDELGRGTHGKVKLGRDLSTDNGYVAIKIVERYSKRRRLGKLGNAEDKVKKEVAILKKARHPNVVALLEVIDDPTRKKVYIVLEWVERGEIQWRIKAPRELAFIEARRYERESRGQCSIDSSLEDAAVIEEAVIEEAVKRLERQKRRQERDFRRMRRATAGRPGGWSMEFGGDMDDDSDLEDADRFSASTATSDSGRLTAAGGQLSRVPSPMPVESNPNSALQSSIEIRHEPALKREPSEPQDALEGTMYGSYHEGYDLARAPSLASSVVSFGPQHLLNKDGGLASVSKLVTEVLERDLNPELHYVPCMTMSAVRSAFRDTVLGLQYLHYQGIIHRDIKPPNLLQSRDHHIKISDFGVSYLGRPLEEGEHGENINESDATDFDEAKELARTVGTAAFYAPELCYTEPSEDVPPVNKAIDVWALGITLFCMLFARTPFVDSEYVVMRQIAEEDIYIPRKRLVPVDEHAKSTSSSKARHHQPMATGHRGELDIEYENIDDELFDLLKRLLTKDPRKRITLEEVRLHPWLLADIANKMQWLEDTDPEQSQGKKIEVSKEDLNTAVVTLTIIDRVKSGVKKIGERFLGRRRAPSSGLPEQTVQSSAASSSSTINQDGRRQSLRGDESILNAIKASREGDHPLSKSVMASPNNKEGEAMDYAPLHPEYLEDTPERVFPSPSRPSPRERAKSTMSTAGSARTVRRSDFRRSFIDESAPPSPGLPGTPTALDSPGGSNLGGLLGGSGRRFLKSVRERSAAGHTNETRGRSTDRQSVESFDQHGEPSLAVSNAMAAGHVDLPQALQETTPANSAHNSGHNSPSGSRDHSVVTPLQHLQLTLMELPISRKSSVSSVASLTGVPSYNGRSRLHSHDHSFLSNESDWQRAEDEHLRKLVNENKTNPDSRPQSSFDSRGCPPSPDDSTTLRLRSDEPSPVDLSNPMSSLETSPMSHNAHLLPGMVSSSSDFGSAVSMSISNPSIPSVISEASSVSMPTSTIDGPPLDEIEKPLSSDDTLNPRAKLHEETDEGYSPDHVVDSEDDYDDSTDSDGGLVMSRRKSGGKGTTGNLTVATDAQIAHRAERRGTNFSARSKKSSRSGSNNTMKKVRTRGSQESRERPSIDTTETSADS